MSSILWPGYDISAERRTQYDLKSGAISVLAEDVPGEKIEAKYTS
jgi:hypothetical protein